jgi:uncharacterized membrane-anchored protein
MRFPSYKLGIVLALVLQIGLLGWIVADRAMLLQNGKEIRLAVVPIDPHDLFRGDYVTLNYNISRVRSPDVGGDDVFARGDTIYVSIVREGDDWKATAIATTPPSSGTFLKGTVRDSMAADPCTGPATGCQAYWIDYNLEKFFVPEGTGRELEALRSDQRIGVDVAVATDGRAALKRLLVDGQAKYEDPPF